MNEANKERIKSIILFFYTISAYLAVRSLDIQPEYKISDTYRITLDMMVTILGVYATCSAIDIIIKSYRWIKRYINKTDKG